MRSKVIRLADMTDEDAIDEGEGYADAAAFRVSHEDHWNGFIDEVREGLGDPGYTITDDTLVVAERFRIAGLLDPDGRPFDPPVRPAYPADRAVVDAFLAAHNADVVARLGTLEDATRQPALIAEVDGELAGVLTWVLRGRSMEVLTLHAARQWAGAGTALVAAARRVAEAVRGSPPLADHDQRQRRRAAVLPAARVPAGTGPRRRGRPVTGRAQARDPGGRRPRHPAA